MKQVLLMYSCTLQITFSKLYLKDWAALMHSCLNKNGLQILTNCSPSVWFLPTHRSRLSFVPGKGWTQANPLHNYHPCLLDQADLVVIEAYHLTRLGWTKKTKTQPYLISVAFANWLQNQFSKAIQNLPKIVP